MVLIEANRLIKLFHMLGDILDVNACVLGVRVVKQFRQSPARQSLPGQLVCLWYNENDEH